VFDRHHADDGVKGSGVERAPTVSIVVPTVGRPELLRGALASVLAQTVDDWEAIVVDNGQLDETRGVVERIDDPRIRLHRQRSRVGIVENWGTGIRLARAEFVSVLADDDKLGPTFIESRLARMREREDLLVAFSRFDVRRLDGSLIRVQGTERREDQELDADGLLQNALSRAWFVGAALYRREAVEHVWPRLALDDLVLDLGLNVRLALFPGARGIALAERDFVMHAHPAQNTEALSDAVWPQTQDALERIERELGNDRRVRVVRSARANWLTVWARHTATAGDLMSARRLLLRAVRTQPRLSWPWRQLALSLVDPDRIRSTPRDSSA
jgi:glycosyltransferase involved in cell wall biosynthesis